MISSQVVKKFVNFFFVSITRSPHKVNCYFPQLGEGTLVSQYSVEVRPVIRVCAAWFVCSNCHDNFQPLEDIIPRKLAQLKGESTQGIKVLLEHIEGYPKGFECSMGIC